MNIEMSKDIFDALARHYREYSAQKNLYLRAVDAFVLRHAPRPARRMLDVGAGDGMRGAELALRLEAGWLVQVEPSEGMAAYCAARSGGEVWRCGAEELPLDAEPFDVIVCLWNVLGHVPGTAARIEALRRMGVLLAPGGALYLDVNNRHNAAAYGFGTVLGRMAVDAVRFDERRGDSTYEWVVGDQKIPAMGHLFIPREMARLFGAAGLRVTRRVSVHYATGRESACCFWGQMLFEAQRSDG